MKEAFPYRRRKDWMRRWVWFIKDSRALGSELRLDWENMNCLKWACMGVEELTGQNPYEMFNPTDGSLLSVAQYIKKSPYDNLDQIIGSCFYEVPIAMAHQGDLVLVEAEWEVGSEIATLMPYAAGLADPPFFWCVLPDGLAKGDLYEVGRKAFAVGRSD